MKRLRGTTYPLVVLGGLVAVVLFLLVFFRLTDQFSAFEYEEQAEITTKNLQTAMNQVCVSGVAQEVDVHYPQKLSWSGVGENPLAFGKSVLTGDTEAVGNALRYMMALDSFGDPWYIIYYEDFPQGEDSGWTGWSSISSQRVASQMFKTADTVACIATSAIPMMGDLKRLGSRAIKGASGSDDIADTYARGRALNQIVKRQDEIAKIAKENPGLAERVWMNEIGQDIVQKGEAGYEKNLKSIFLRFSDPESNVLNSPLNRH
ncbi:MAG: hypothetical protein ACP5E4_01335, partial [Candidatus Aenigmatarchaeota archaeon]